MESMADTIIQARILWADGSQSLLLHTTNILLKDIVLN